MKLKMPEAPVKKLELGDYVSVFVPDLNNPPATDANLYILQEHRDAFIQRILKQRGKSIDMQSRSAA